MMGGDWSGWGWGMGFGGIFMILFWVVVILGVVALAKWIFSPGGAAGPSSPARSALEILKERYARGEIDRDQYQQMRRDLES